MTRRKSDSTVITVRIPIALEGRLVRQARRRGLTLDFLLHVADTTGWK
jgi:hypothetical protein